MEFAKIVLLSIAAAICYGILHDQVTARICVEYFTVFHPPVFPTDDPTLLALGWGVIATWWLGAFLGVVLAISARTGRRRKVAARELVRPVLRVLAVMALKRIVVRDDRLRFDTKRHDLSPRMGTGSLAAAILQRLHGGL